MRKLCYLALSFFLSSAAWAQGHSPVVILIPGAGSSGDRIHIQNLDWATQLMGGDRYFGRFQEELSALGMRNFVCPIDQDDDQRSIEERSDACAREILQDEGIDCQNSRNVILVGHSMGGLVARVLAQDPRVSGCIQSVTTLSTPHQGTVLADFAIEHSDQAWDFYGAIVRMIGFIPERLRYLAELKSDRAGAPPELFRAQETPDNPAVQYFSISDSMSFIPIPTLEITRGMISRQLAEQGLDQTPFGKSNDGIVPEYSMIHGTFLGHLNANHWATACADPVRETKACERTLAFLLPHLRRLYGQAGL